MTVLIYFVCFAVASLIQTTLRYMLAAGDVAGIPGAFIFSHYTYLVFRTNTSKVRDEQA